MVDEGAPMRSRTPDWEATCPPIPHADKRPKLRAKSTPLKVAEPGPAKACGVSYRRCVHVTSLGDEHICIISPELSYVILLSNLSQFKMHSK